jgi:hemolysin activation/secretion protein
LFTAGAAARFRILKTLKFCGGVSIPYGYSLLDYSYSWNNYLNTLDNNGNFWRSSGDTETHRVNLSHVLFRNGDIKTGVSVGLSHRINHNYLDDILLKSSSRTLTSLQFGLSHTQKMFGGVATFNPTLSRGMPWLNAERRQQKRRFAESAVP